MYIFYVDFPELDDRSDDQSLYYVCLGSIMLSAMLMTIVYLTEKERRGALFSNHQTVCKAEEQRSIFAKLNVALILLDGRTVIWKNPTCDQIFMRKSVKLGSSLGKNWITGGENQKILTWIEGIRAESSEGDAEFQYLDGSLDPVHGHHLHIKLSKIHWDNRECYLLTIGDRTAEKTISNLNSKWISTVSHEFRTPLNTLMNLIERLSHAKLDLIEKKFLHIGRSATGLMQSHVGDLLDYCQLKGGKFSISIRGFQVTNVVENSITMLQSKAEDKHITLKPIFHNVSSDSIYNDQWRFQQVLVNLIGNAIKFTPKYGVIQVGVHQVSADLVEIFVKDSGIGIKKKDKTKIFQEYGRVADNETEALNPQGVGLGLWICRGVCDQLGNGLKVDSEHGLGSTFSFTLLDKGSEMGEKMTGRASKSSLTESHFKDSTLEDVMLMVDGEEDEVNSKKLVVNRRIKEHTSRANPFLETCDYTEVSADAEEEEDESLEDGEDDIFHGTICTESGESAKVLVVDDEPHNRFIIETFCEKLNLSVDTACDGQEAIDKVTKRMSYKVHNYDLIILDYEMPVMKGPEVCHRLRELLNNEELDRSIPVIGYTAHTAKRDLDFFLDSGAQSIIVKPVSFQQFEEVVRGFFSSQSSRRSMVAKAPR
eukprot:CAMPEP_0115004484 /NCGR_PEP_ID=MMETSP0216-20121206/19241_1 /TAXON_ID=223996 /ORGANISM="Protocruzia adherens, Strain Boccale" /LENGTH=651 /DNA_ID=CAMNT_0002370503 /DNA_START=523 /DNA_END=2478 /DNA_ORIENTATION=-